MNPVMVKLTTPSIMLVRPVPGSNSEYVKPSSVPGSPVVAVYTTVGLSSCAGNVVISSGSPVPTANSSNRTPVSVPHRY